MSNLQRIVEACVIDSAGHPTPEQKQNLIDEIKDPNIEITYTKASNFTDKKTSGKFGHTAGAALSLARGFKQQYKGDNVKLIIRVLSISRKAKRLLRGGKEKGIGYVAIDNFFNRHPNISIATTSFGVRRTGDYDYFPDQFNELATKNGRNIAFFAAQPNEGMNPATKANISGYQDGELKNTKAAQNVLLVAPEQRTKKPGRGEYVAEHHEYAGGKGPQIHFQPRYGGTSFSAPLLAGSTVGALAKWTEEAARQGSLNGNQVLPAIIINDHIDKRIEGKAEKFRGGKTLGGAEIKFLRQAKQVMTNTLDDLKVPLTDPIEIDYSGRLTKQERQPEIKVYTY